MRQGLWLLLASALCWPCGARAQLRPTPGSPAPAHAAWNPKLDPALVPNAPPLTAAVGGVPLSLLQAVTTTLRRHPALVNARAAVEVARGDMLTAAGQFDTTLRAGFGHTRAIAPGFDPETSRKLPTRTDATDLAVGASKTLHFGTVIAADAGVTRSDIHGGLPSFMQTGNVGLSVTQPLLRGAGTVGAASTLQALELHRRSQ